jgi:microsomal dipeptidase-like Zn-dependent dipeptidase
MALLDLHTHFSFKPANSSSYDTAGIPDPDHWRERLRRKEDHVGIINVADRTVIKTSQAQGDMALAGGFRVICNALYPLERGFTGALALKPAAMLCGFSHHTMRDIHQGKVSYFQHLEREYMNLVQNQNKHGYTAPGNAYRVVDSYGELERILADGTNTLCVVNTVEGAHAFADNLYDRRGVAINIHSEERRFVRQVGRRSGESWFELYIEAMITNIDKVTSNWSHTPFFVSLGHHYYNHLCGHSPSLGIIDLLFNQDGGVLDHDGTSIVNYYYLGIRPWGKKVVAHLLRRRNQLGTPVRRVLIDTKHMSPQARLDYMEIVEQLRANDPIPIIASHTAVSGRKDLKASIAADYRLLPGEGTSTQYFYDGIINLFDDEIVRIVASDGIMGLMIDERRIMGKALPPEAGISMAEFNVLVKKNKKALKAWFDKKHEHAWGNMSSAEFAQEAAAHAVDMATRTPQLKPCYLSVLFRQIFHILELVGQEGWQHIAIGTDYDGLINPVDIYPQANEMTTLKKDLVDHWKLMTEHPDAAIKAVYTKHLYGKSAAHWIEKVLWQNGMDFLRKYYNDDYLRNGKMIS